MKEYLDILNEQQKAAVIHEGSPLLILAGAGSGKTRVITTKIAYLISEKNIAPWSILSVTFTKKAANEMRERAIALNEDASKCQIKTFHSFGAWFLRRYAEVAELSPSFTVYDDADMAIIIKEVVPSLSLKEVKTVARQIAIAKDYCLSPEDDLSMICSDFDIADIYKKYENRLRATGNTDFGDLIMMPVTIMNQYEEIADYIHNRFRVIMVDEYQDSNIAQYKLLQCISGIEKGNNSYVCVVGDDDQSIYHFRGAEVENILTFPEKFSGTEIIRLERNYRSTENILNLASMVVSKNQNRLGKKLIADRGKGGEPVLVFLPDQNSEASFVADLISKSVISGAKYSDWAVLYRTNAQSLCFEKEFLHRKIPYIVVGSLKFYEREEIKDAIAYLNLCANPRDVISFRRIVNKPTRGIGEKTKSKIIDSAVSVSKKGEPIFTNLIEATRAIKDSFTKKTKEGAETFVKLFDILSESFDKEDNLSVFIKRLIEDSHLDEFHKAGDVVEGTQRVANLQELINSAVPYECSKNGLVEFLDAINLDRTLEMENGERIDDSVTLITLHNTKGLEYNKVIITGLEEGIFPHMGKIGKEIEEERRLFYVGITRARDELYVTSTRSRLMYGSWQPMAPSSFLKDAVNGFKIIGNVPFGFSNNVVSSVKAKFIENNINKSYVSEKYDELSEKWKKGTRLFHDEYGYGAITSTSYRDTEFVITVQFENSGIKKFMPKYQAGKLTIIKD